MDKGNINHSTYCDITGFINQEIIRMDSLQRPLMKFTNWKGITSTDTSLLIDWKKELVLFSDIKISSSVWRTDYEIIDSQYHNGQITRTFGALLPNQEVRLIRIITNDSYEVSRLEVEMRIINKFTRSSRKMSYTKDKGYTIIGNRKTKLMKDENFKIVCQLLSS
jgi:hypothetical protein